MNAGRLLQHFNRISEAPDAIPCLRRFILDLAVRGKLVEQDPNDEPASELFKRIQRERARLVGEGEVKKLELFDPIEGSDIPFAIPSGWQVAHMGWLARKLGAGSTPLGGKTVYQKDGVPFLRSQNVHNGGLRLDDVALIPRPVHERMSGTHIQRNDILLNITGASIGRCALVPSTFMEGNVSQHVAIIRLFVPDIREFIHLSLISPSYQRLIDDVQVGVSREGLSMQRLKMFSMPLPPLAEQHRIVAKVDELMALCDQLDAAKAEREQSRDRLVAASLHRLNQPAETTEADAPDAFRDHARFTFQHLPRLTTRPAHIKQLRQTILNLAVRGTLVEQDPRDEPAVELLKRIQGKLQRIPEESRVLFQSNTSIEDEPIPFYLPAGWCWVQLQQLLETDRQISYGIIKLGEEPKTGGVFTLRCSDVKSRYIEALMVRRVSDEIEREYARTRLIGGEILLNIRGTLGGVALVPPEMKGFNVAREVAVIPISQCVAGEYAVNVMASDFFWGNILNNLRGIAYKGLNLGTLRLFNFPLPPLAEQHRIVAKVDELMSLCDQLEAQLTTTETDSRRLLEAVLHEALNPPLEATEQ